MGQNDEKFTSTITGKEILIKPILIEALSNGVDQVLYTCEPTKQKQVARKAMRPLEASRYTGDNAKPAELEIGALKDLCHPHCVDLVNVYTTDDNSYGSCTFILTGPIAETDLADLLGSPMSQKKRDQISCLFRCLINGLGHIHAKGLVHMDMKPSNILLLQKDIYFTDFGPSVKSPKLSGSTTDHGVSGTRTPEYCAPEVEAGCTPRPSADIFALGAVFLELLAACCQPGYLNKFKGENRAEDDEEFSWANCHVKFFESIRKKIEHDGSGPWPKFKSMLFLCQLTMDPRESQRPTASALSQCWTYADCVALPKPVCTSNECRTITTAQNLDEALREALEAEHSLAVELLCYAGADVNTRYKKGGLLHFAALRKNYRVLGAYIQVCRLGKIGSETDCKKSAWNLAHSSSCRVLVKCVDTSLFWALAKSS